MATTWFELVGSRKAKVGPAQPTATMSFIGQSTTEDDIEANMTLQLVIPLVYPGSAYVQLLYQDYDIEHIGGGIWKAEVHFARQDALYTFEIGGGTEKITEAIKEVDVFTAPGVTNPQFGTTIGWDGKTVHGKEINVTSGHWEETYYFPPAQINDDFKQTIRRLAWTKNDDTFRNCDSGSVLFRGARGSQRGVNNIEITFAFAEQPNDTNLDIGAVSVTYKDGWDILDIFYQPKVDTNSHLLRAEPTVVRVLQVFKDGDFSQLGIGT